jgi:peroxiredoxin
MPKVKPGDQAINFTFDTLEKTERDFFQATEGKTALIFLLRYYGCTGCQFEVLKIFQDAAKFKEAGAEVFVVLQSEAETVKTELAGREIPFTIIVDPRQKLYATFAIGSRDPTVERTEAHKAKIAQAKALGLTHGKFEGNEYQLPAVLIFTPDRKVLYAYYGQESSDVPEHEEILAVLGKASAAA